MATKHVKGDLRNCRTAGQRRTFRQIFGFLLFKVEVFFLVGIRISMRKSKSKAGYVCGGAATGARASCG